MGKYLTIDLDERTTEVLEHRASQEGKLPEILAAEILNLMLAPPHSMNEEELKAGYEESGPVNLEWANLGLKE